VIVPSKQSKLSFGDNEVGAYIDTIHNYFLRLKECTGLADCLSGDERRMLAFDRTMTPRPKMIPMDETALRLSRSC
jgi:ABC-type branched-subunit amino acid transport system ATPase component